MNEGHAAAAGAALTGIGTGAGAAARYLAIAIGFTLPISTALDNVLLALLLACWLASGRWETKYNTIRGNPVALAALAYLALMVLGLLWSPDPLQDGLTYLKKFSQLMLIAILVTEFTDPQTRRYGLLALAAGIALTLLLSLALSVGVLPTGGSSPASQATRPCSRSTSRRTS
jgi:O-antigen ligase